MRVVPRAPRNEVAGERDGRILIRTTAAPVDGRANDAVRRLLAEHLGIRPRDVELVSGERSRDKVFRVSGR
ncbi:MAG: DUF167 domain-containing protein [Microthrixaceae bacterium]